MVLENRILWGTVTSWLAVDLGQIDSGLELGERERESRWRGVEELSGSRQKGPTEQGQTVTVYNALSFECFFFQRRLRLGEGLCFNRNWFKRQIKNG